MSELSLIVKQLAEYYEAHPLTVSIRGNKVGIEPIFDPDMTKGGLYIPEQAKGRCTQGIVKARGPKVSDDVQIGDYVLFSGYDGDLLRLEDGLVIIMPDTQIMGKFIIDEYIHISDTSFTLSELIAKIASQLEPIATMDNISKLESRTKK